MKEISYTDKRHPKLLLVDDKPENLLVLQKVLTELEVELITATSGNEALKHTLNHEFALALLDVQMPQMDGYELAEILREEESTYELPIIFISAIYTDRLNVFKGFEKGAFSFITKPFEPPELLNKVRFFIEKFHMEKAFQESRAKYMELYNSSPDMLISLDMETTFITECNDTLLKNTGYLRTEIIGKSIFDIYHPDCLQEAQQAFRNFAQSGKVENIELILKMKDGAKLNVLFNATGMRDVHGKIIHSNTSLRNITELKSARIRLEKTLKELQRSNDELENFVYLTSHDLQEPMLSVISFIELFKKEYEQQFDENAEKYLQYTLESANRMKELITCLLDYLRIGREKIIDPIDLPNVLNDVLEELQPSIQLNRAEILMDELPQITGCEEEIRHLFQNLISNAIKFKKKDQKPIIRIFSKEEELNWVFCVEDNGIGISQQHFHKAFSIFKQLHKRGVYEGMGVGLAICKKIIEEHGGKIWVESLENQGSKFYFTILKQHSYEEQNL
ncbi:ATP-binding protein [Rapidithrix thailandica]|uniref:histidine kinase n=1 Tax=Rapidithrix thailandica TaxID=413964 RepID=A0AAW9RXM0_9BACT